MTRGRVSSNSVFSFAHDVTQDVVFQRFCFRTASESQSSAVPPVRFSDVLAGSTPTDEVFLQQQTLVALGVIAHSRQPVKSTLDVKR